MSEELKPIAYLHKITEPDMEAMQVFSWSADNPWSHWLSSHMEKCSYSVTPLYDSQARLSEAVKVLEEINRLSMVIESNVKFSESYYPNTTAVMFAMGAARQFLATLGEENVG